MALLHLHQKWHYVTKRRDEFDAFCEISVIPIEQLYGGKICAALDRQHPRDLFDIKYLLENEGFANEIKKGFLLCLLGSKRPIYEMLFPNLLDQRKAMANQFDGMSAEIFTYEDFETTRNQIVQTIHENLNDLDKQFLLRFENGTPDWSLYNFEDYPSCTMETSKLTKTKRNKR